MVTEGSIQGPREGHETKIDEEIVKRKRMWQPGKLENRASEDWSENLHCFVFLFRFFFIAVLGLLTKLRGRQRFPLYLSYPHMHSLPHYEHHPPEWYISYLRVTLGIVHSMSSDKSIMTYPLLQYTEYFHCFCALFIQLSSLPTPYRGQLLII